MSAAAVALSRSAAYVEIQRLQKQVRELQQANRDLRLECEVAREFLGLRSVEFVTKLQRRRK